MLGLRLQIFILLISFFFTVFIIHFIRKEVLELKYTLVWIVTGLIILLISLFPQIVAFLAESAGIQTPVNALFLMGLLFALIIIFTLTVAISKISLRVTRLAQEISILKFELIKYKKERDKKSSEDI